MSQTLPEANEPLDVEDEDNLPQPIETILEQLPREERGPAEAILRRHVAQYSGRVPHAQEMARFKEVDPTFPERFMVMAERQSEHRRNLETKVVQGDLDLKSRGQNYALISIFVILGFALVLALIGATTAAGIVGGATVVGVVSAFIVGRAIESRASENKGSDEDED